MKITKETLNKIEKQEASGDFLEWANQVECLILEIKNKGIKEKINNSLFRYCVEKAPNLVVIHTKELLNPEQVQYCVYEAPGYAIRYGKELLTPNQIQHCVENATEYTFKYAEQLLTTEQIQFCAKKIEVN